MLTVHAHDDDDGTILALAVIAVALIAVVVGMILLLVGMVLLAVGMLLLLLLTVAGDNGTTIGGDKSEYKPVIPKTSRANWT
jgi:uncharacterized membrane protein